MNKTENMLVYKFNKRLSRIIQLEAVRETEGSFYLKTEHSKEGIRVSKKDKFSAYYKTFTEAKNAAISYHEDRRQQLFEEIRECERIIEKMRHHATYSKDL